METIHPLYNIVQSMSHGEKVAEGARIVVLNELVGKVLDKVNLGFIVSKEFKSF